MGGERGERAEGVARAEPIIRADGSVDGLGPLRRVASDLRSEADEPDAEQSERLLEQMRKCILVHHQLSCLLIHHSSLKAGLYGQSESDEANASMSAVECQMEVEESIQHIGGSTARLFSMALRDDHDLEAMEETLQNRVDEMIQSMRNELVMAGYSTDRGPMDTAQTLAMLGLDNDLVRSVGSAAEAEISIGSAEDPDASLRVAEAETLSQECALLSAELAARQAEATRLQRELDETWNISSDFHHSVTTRYFDEVQTATARNSELENVLEQLMAGIVPPEYQALAAGAPPISRPLEREESTRAGALCAVRREPVERHGARLGASAGPAPPMAEAVQESARIVAPQPAHVAPATEPLAQPHRAEVMERARPRTPVQARARPPGVSVHLPQVVPTPPPQQFVSRSDVVAATSPQLIHDVATPCPELLAHLDVQLRASQSEFWGM